MGFCSKKLHKYYIHESCNLRFTIFEIIFTFLFWKKNFKRIACAKARLLQIDCVEISLIDAAVRRYSSKQVILKIFDKVVLKFFIKKRLQHRNFPVNIRKFLETAFVIDHRSLLSTWPYYILSMINELIAFSSYAMSQAI